jgi:hypothetical protein
MSAAGYMCTLEIVNRPRLFHACDVGSFLQTVWRGHNYGLSLWQASDSRKHMSALGWKLDGKLRLELPVFQTGANQRHSELC